MIPERYSPITYALLRIVFGFLWIFHGLQKYGVFGDEPLEVTSLRGVAGLVEIVAGTLIMVGLFTRPAAFVASGQMAFAYFLAHVPLGNWPILNGGEQAVLFCFAFLYVASKGAGIWSLDARLRQSV
jgi:putative oxidoreductase